MNQVFISNHMAGIQASADHALWGSLAHSVGAADGHAAAMVGVWDPINQVFLDGTTAALGLINPQNVAAITAAGSWATAQQGTIIADGADLATSQHPVNTLPSNPSWLNSAFQIVQAMPSDFHKISYFMSLKLTLEGLLLILLLHYLQLLIIHSVFTK